MQSQANYRRNIQGKAVTLRLTEVDPDKVKLDPTNPRVGFSIRQLEQARRSDAACALLLTSQEETEALKKSIILSGGVQEPIYVRHDGTVAEGNRRVVAMRAAKEGFPKDARFKTIPAWLIPRGTPEQVVQDLLNEIHLGAVRGWAPYEKALQMRGLLNSGLIEEEIAERYRMTANDVKQHIHAADLMDNIYFPITKDPSDPEHRTKFSYFLEFQKSGRIQKHCEGQSDLPKKFARWVRDGQIDTGMRVRKLPKILDTEEAVQLLEIEGFDAAEEFLAHNNPKEQESYLLFEKTRVRLRSFSVSELVEVRQSPERLSILQGLKSDLETVLNNIGSTSAKPRRSLGGRSKSKAKAKPRKKRR